MEGTGRRPAAALATVDLFGLDFVSEADLAEVADVVLAEAGTPVGWRCLVTPNVDHLVMYRRKPAMRAVAEEATTVLPDGMPIVWTSRLVKRPLRARLAGSDLFSLLWPRLAAEQVPVVVISSRPEVSEHLRAEHPGVALVDPPMFSLDRPDEVAAVLEEVVAACDRVGARLLVSGISTDKGHHLAGLLRERWRDDPAAPTVLLLGASAELYVGVRPRAPEWMQRTGLEWLHRLASDPRRLARRYLVDDVTFFGDVVREWRRCRREDRG